MNLRAVRWLLGSLSLVVAAFLVVPAAVSFVAGEPAVARGFLLSAAAAAGLGALLVLLNRGSLETAEGRPAFFLREGLTVVAFAWVVAGVLGALPFLLCGATDSLTDALFESISGFTTTGSSIFDAGEIDALPVGIVFWRALTHWIGGIGIVVVFVAILPTGGRALLRSEGRDPAEKARIRDTAFGLLRVYVLLTAAHAALLWAAGMGPLDAVMHGFSTLATGGFSSRGASIAHYDSALIEVILIVFMIAAGINFALWGDVLLRGPARGFEAAARSTELRVYLGSIAGMATALTFVLWFWGGSNGDPASDLPHYESFGRSARDAWFSLVSIMTCTGYATADFDRWPEVCRMLLMLAAAVGGCAGSTAGGIKIVRVVIVVRAALAAVRGYASPRTVQRVTLDGEALEDAAITGALRHFALWVLAAALLSLAMTLFGSDPVTSVTSVVSSLNNVGPGLGAVGPAGNYGFLDGASKLVLCLAMILGRLEFYALVALVQPRFWRR